MPFMVFNQITFDVYISSTAFLWGYVKNTEHYHVQKAKKKK